MLADRRKCGFCGAAVAQRAACLIDDVATFRDEDDEELCELYSLRRNNGRGRLVELPAPDRRTFAHLSCAITRNPARARRALLAADRELLRELLEEVGRLSPALADEVAWRLMPVRRNVPLDDAATTLIRELEAAPADRTLLAVLGDHLMHRGDERGELIMHQLAGSDAKRCADLVEVLSPRIGPSDELTWGVGFVRDAHFFLEHRPLASRSIVLDHPSCRLLQRLSLWPGWRSTAKIAVPPGSVPHGVRVFETVGLLLDADLSWLPFLDTLILDRCTDVAHPTVGSVELRGPDRETLLACARGLPRAERLTIGRTPRLAPPDALDRILDESGWLARLRELVLVDVEATPGLRDRTRHFGVHLIESAAA